jgi:hypothetical protein
MHEFDDAGAPRRPAAELRRVAHYQRWIVGAVFAQLALWVGYFGLTRGYLPEFGDQTSLPVMLTFVIGIGGGVYAFLIYWIIRDPVWAGVMGLACFLPFLGLLALTVVNGTATRFLTANGVPVGWFCADPDAIEESAGCRGLYEEDGGW